MTMYETYTQPTIVDDELHSLFESAIAGFYDPNETDERLAQILEKAPHEAFFQLILFLKDKYEGRQVVHDNPDGTQTVHFATRDAKSTNQTDLKSLYEVKNDSSGAPQSVFMHVNTENNFAIEVYAEHDGLFRLSSVSPGYNVTAYPGSPRYDEDLHTMLNFALDTVTIVENRRVSAPVAAFEADNEAQAALQLMKGANKVTDNHSVEASSNNV